MTLTAIISLILEYILYKFKLMKKKLITSKIERNIKKYLQKIKPKSSKNLKQKNIEIILDIIFWLIWGQECFLNTIVQNTKYYQKKLKEYEKWK